MTRIAQFYSDISRLGRETAMLDAVVLALSDELLQRPAANDQTQVDILVNLVNKGYGHADAINAETGHTPNYERDEIVSSDQVIHAYREAQQQFTAATALLPTLAEITLIPHGAVNLRPGELVPHRIAETVQAHERLLCAWSIEEAAPDSVQDAIEA